MSDDEKRAKNHNTASRSNISANDNRSAFESRSAGSTTISDSMRDRSEQELEAKGRSRNESSAANDDGNGHPAGARLDGNSEQSHVHRSRRTEEELEAKRRALDPSEIPSSDGTEIPNHDNTRQIDPPRSSATTSQGVEVHAELVNEAEEIERARQQLQEENERFGAQIDAENEEYRRQLASSNVQTQVVVVEATEVTNDDDDEGKFFSKQCSIMVLVLVFLVGAGVGAYFGLKPPLDPIAADPASNLPTPTSPPTILPPTLAPTPGLLYPKPTAKECQSIISGGQIDGQESLATRGYEVQLLVSTQQDTNVNDILDALRITTQVLLIPELVGCLGSMDPRKLRRVLAETNVRRYAIANGNFVSSYISDQNCVSEGDGPCHRVMTTLSLAIKDEQESDLVLLGLLTDIYGVEDLKSKLLLGSPFESITLGGIKAVQLSSNTDPTESPAASPTTNGNDDLLTSNPVSSPTDEPDDNRFLFRRPPNYRSFNRDRVLK